MKPSAIPAELLTYEEAARMCGSSRASICRAVQSGELIAVQAPGTNGPRGRRILRSSIEDYIEQEVAATARQERK